MPPASLDIGRDAFARGDDPIAQLAAARRAATKGKSKKKKAKKLPVCTKRDLKTKKSKRRKCRVVKPKPKPIAVVAPKPSPTGPVAAPPVTTPSADAFPTPPLAEPTDGLRTYAGPFGPEQAQRLLFRAGFGPRPGQTQAVAAGGLRSAVQALMEPGAVRLDGPAPAGAFLVGGALAPADKYGHTHLDLLDRQVRSTDQLTERMVLVLHDWFAVSEDGAHRTLMGPHLELLRRSWRGSFRQLLLDVTKDPAMLLFLDGTSNRRGAPNENYGRELMELYGLGADRGAYTEDDVREMARALTGWRNDYSDAIGPYNFRYDPARHDSGVKTIFAGTPHERSGRLGWEDAVHAVVDHPLHPSFVVRKLWSSFIPTEPSAETQRQLEALYRSRGEQLGPLVEAILLHPDLHAGPAMIKSPVVFAAGLLRATRQGSAPTRGSAGLRAQGSCSATRRTWPGGTTARGSTRRRTARAGASCRRFCVGCRSRVRPTAARPRRQPTRWSRRSPSGATPSSPPITQRRCAGSPKKPGFVARSATHTGRWRASWRTGRTRSVNSWRQRPISR